jgi:hypothetical protein
MRQSVAPQISSTDAKPTLKFASVGAAIGGVMNPVENAFAGIWCWEKVAKTLSEILFLAEASD